jgi:hypothetical protein
MGHTGRNRKLTPFRQKILLENGRLEETASLMVRTGMITY